MRQALSTQDWDAIQTWQQASEHRFVLSPTDANYPPLLKEITLRPDYLFIEGQISLLNQWSIAMVGSRNPTATGIETAQRFAFELTQAGFVITSGLAIGVDTACHLGAIKHNGATIAVLGTGIDVIYPRQNRALSQRILDSGGVLMSEYRLGTPPLAHNFPKRNRIIAGISMGVLVVEATLKSGSLITARLALEYNRELFAVPGSIHNPLSKGCHQLLRNGAKLVETTQDVYEELGQFIRTPIPFIGLDSDSPQTEKLAKGCDLLVKCVGYEPTPLDVIVLRSGLSAATVGVRLLELELLGIIDQRPDGYMRKG